MHTYYINEIIKSNDNKKMTELKDIYEELIKYLKEKDPDKYKEVECSLYEIVEGKRLTKEKAIEWVESMKPAAKWTIQDIEKLQASKRVDIPLVDLYALMNMMYTDYFDVIEEDEEKYLKMSLDWYNDKDTKKTGSEKLYCYYKNIVR